MLLLHLYAILYHTNRNVGIHVSQHIQVQINELVNFNDVLTAHFGALGVADNGNGAVQLVKAQKLNHIDAVAGYGPEHNHSECCQYSYLYPPSIILRTDPTAS